MYTACGLQSRSSAHSITLDLQRSETERLWMFSVPSRFKHKDYRRQFSSTVGWTSGFKIGISIDWRVGFIPSPRRCSLPACSALFIWEIRFLILYHKTRSVCPERSPRVLNGSLRLAECPNLKEVLTCTSIVDMKASPVYLSMNMTGRTRKQNLGLSVAFTSGMQQTRNEMN